MLLLYTPKRGVESSTVRSTTLHCFSSLYAEYNRTNRFKSFRDASVESSSSATTDVTC